MLTEAEIRFVLTKGGHNAGIVSEPGHPRRNYRILTRPAGQPAIDPDEWLARSDFRDGSWWIAWGEWLDAHSGELAPPPPMGDAARGYAPIADAPGVYILEQ